MARLNKETGFKMVTNCAKKKTTFFVYGSTLVNKANCLFVSRVQASVCRSGQPHFAFWIIDYGCDGGEVWISAQDCRNPIPNSQKKEITIDIRRIYNFQNHYCMFPCTRMEYTNSSIGWRFEFCNTYDQYDAQISTKKAISEKLKFRINNPSIWTVFPPSQFFTERVFFKRQWLAFFETLCSCVTSDAFVALISREVAQLGKFFLIVPSIVLDLNLYVSVLQLNEQDTSQITDAKMSQKSWDMTRGA
jgi:hypothetical protein